MVYTTVDWVSPRDVLRHNLLEDLMGNPAGYLSFDKFARKNHKILSYFYGMRIVTNEALDIALAYVAGKNALANYRGLMHRIAQGERVFADDAHYPEFLVYGIEQGWFFRRGIKSIPLEEDSLEEFCNFHRRPNLIIGLRERLLNPPEPLKISNVGFCHDPFCY